MKSLEQLKNMATETEKARGTVEALGAELSAKMAKLQDGTRTHEYVHEESAKLKETYIPEIEKAVGKVGINGLDLATRQWSNTDFVLSKRAVSERVNPHPAAQAKDAIAEAMTRLMLMQNFSRMNDDLLRLTAADAKATGQQGQLYLINAELAARGVEGVDLSDVVLEDQKQALDFLRRCEAGKQGALLALRTAAGGRQPSPVEKINQARLDEVAI